MELLIHFQTSAAALLEWIGNFAPQFVMDVIIYPYKGQS